MAGITVEFRSMPAHKKFRWGKEVLDVQQSTGFDFVMVNGAQAGYVPTDEKDPNYRVFHPLSGFPQELCREVVSLSGGRLTSSLRAPQPQPQPADEDDAEL